MTAFSNPNSITLESYIASKTTFARRKIMELLKEGKITVNGNKATAITQLITPQKDIVKVGSSTYKTKVSFAVYKFYKPKNIISTLEDPKGRPCLASYTKSIKEPVFPVGRLDRQTTGLILFTNDGQLANHILHPSYQLKKRYKVSLDKNIKPAHIERLTAGLFLEDGPIQYVQAEQISSTSLYVTLTEGRNRIIRRTFDALGYTVTKLHRLSIGPIELGKLKEGESKPLSPNEEKALYSCFT